MTTHPYNKMTAKILLITEFLKSVGFVGLADKNMLSLTKIDSLLVRRTGKEFQ